MPQLDGKKVAVLATDGFEQSELLEPLNALRAAGAKVDVVAPEAGTIRGWDHTDWGQRVPVDQTLAQVGADDYDALVLPGGQINPDKLRLDERAISMVRSMYQQRKPVAAICHAPWLLIEAGVIEGRTVTSFASIKTDVQNAGAHWVDEAVVVDQGLVTSRNPGDLKAFCAKVIEEIGEGRHQQRATA